MDFNYRREIPNAQEPWMHTHRVVKPMSLMTHTHRVICKFGICPCRTEHVVGKHHTATRNVFIVRNVGIGFLPKWPSQ